MSTYILSIQLKQNLTLVSHLLGRNVALYCFRKFVNSFSDPPRAAHRFCLITEKRETNCSDFSVQLCLLLNLWLVNLWISVITDGGIYPIATPMPYPHRSVVVLATWDFVTLHTMKENQRKLFCSDAFSRMSIYFQSVWIFFLTEMSSHCECFYIKQHFFLFFLSFLCSNKYLSQNFTFMDKR